MRFVCFTDLHVYGPHALFDKVPKEPGAFYLGDNHDLKNCLKKDVSRCRSEMRWLKAYAKNRYLSGNHELVPLTEGYMVFVSDQKTGNKIGLTHGDYLSWGLKKAVAFRSRKPGAGRLKRLLVGMTDKVRDMFSPTDLSLSFQSECAREARLHGLNVIIMGHKHPKGIIRKVFDGIEIIVLPRGRNEFEV